VPEECIGKGVYVKQSEFDVGLSDYYAVRGWTDDGIPTPKKLKEVGLEDLIPIVDKKIKALKKKK
jgi:aldehyde:ferredoxin oxidoreductase